MKKVSYSFEENGQEQVVNLYIYSDGITAECNGQSAIFPIKRDPRALANEIYHLVYTGDDRYHRAAKTSEITDWLTNGDGGTGRSVEALAAEWCEYDIEPEKDAIE